jgi:glycosyltransferase involved in cell wall biosynthesis
MEGISRVAQEAGYNTWLVSSYERPRLRNKKYSKQNIIIGNFFSLYIHIALGHLTGLSGVFSIFSTKRLIKRLENIKPDIIHLHNLHDCYINIPILFRYIKTNKIPVIWTLHDCWAFTGHCPYFEVVECNKWKTGCHDCPQYRKYPKSYIDNSKYMYIFKKKWFHLIQNMILVTPSEWLASLVKQSYLKDFPVKVINNGINLTVFKPSLIGSKENFKKKYHISNERYIVLGVSYNWNYRKGIDVFIELSKRLDGDRYQIVLVGADERLDVELPGNIIAIQRTQNQQELADIYSAADVFVNPTREENFPTVNLESIACGTPVVSFRSGGSPECITEKTGSIVDRDNIDEMEKEIVRICETRPYKKEACVEYAQSFDMNRRFDDYVKLYASFSKS